MTPDINALDVGALEPLTKVLFHFIDPNGLPMANRFFEIQLAESNFVDEDGVLMPKVMYVQTDEEGKYLAKLRESKKPYYVLMEGDTPQDVIAYSFYVPKADYVVRAQDLFIAVPPSEVPYDEEAIRLLTQYKLDAEKAADNAKESEDKAKASEIIAVDAAADAEHSLSLLNDAVDRARAHADASETSRQAADASKEAAKTSEINAKASETSVANSATASNTAKTAAEAARDIATAKATEAVNSAQEAKDSQIAAKTSEDAAKDSQDAAKVSETNSKASEIAAEAAANAANDSEVSAKASETSAASSASIATKKASEASISAAEAKTSETNAKASETAAKASETKAKESETKAKTSEVNAKVSETVASDKANIATAKANEASTSASEALASEGKAKTSETNAKNSETAAKASETAANNSKNQAAASASTATTKATEASNSADASSASAILSADSASIAVAAKSEAVSAKVTAVSASESALTSANNADSFKVLAQEAASGAKASELLAKDWAIKEGDTVDGVDYSAKHYAQIAHDVVAQGTVVAHVSTGTIEFEGDGNPSFPLKANFVGTKADVGLDQVDNTSDLDKPVSTATQAALDLKAGASELSDLEDSITNTLVPLIDTKVDKVTGKGLSDENYSLPEKNKLAGIAAGATKNATDAQLRDRSTHTGEQAISTVTGLQSALDSKVDLTDHRLTNSREWTASEVSQAEAEAGTDTTARKWTAQRVRQNVAAYTYSKVEVDNLVAGASPGIKAWQNKANVTQLEVNVYHKLTLTSPRTLKLPRNPPENSFVELYATTGDLKSTIIDPNGKTLMGLSESMEIDRKIYGLRLEFLNNSWRVGM